MKNQIQLNPEMLDKLLHAFKKDEINIAESPVGPVTIPIKKVKFEDNRVLIPLRIHAFGAGEMVVCVKLENGIELNLNSAYDTKNGG